MSFMRHQFGSDTFHKAVVTHTLQRTVLRLLFGMPEVLQRAILTFWQQQHPRSVNDPAIQMMLLLGSMMPGVDTDATPDEIRDQYSQAIRLVGPEPDPEIKVEDVVLAGPSGPVSASLFWKGRRLDQPCLVFFHGGGYIFGDVASYCSLCRAIAAISGLAVLSVDYRLAPEHPFPAAFEDCLAAFRAWREIAPDYDIDPTRVAIGGDSAGAQLAASICLIMRDSGEALPCYQWLLYPPTEFLPVWSPAQAASCAPSADKETAGQIADGFGLDLATIQWFARQYVPNGAKTDDPRLSPLRAQRHDGLPPALIVTGGLDPLCDQGKAYGEALGRCGVPVRHLHYPTAIHGFIAYAGVLELGRVALEEAARALAHAMAPDEAIGRAATALGDANGHSITDRCAVL